MVKIGEPTVPACRKPLVCAYASRGGRELKKHTVLVISQLARAHTSEKEFVEFRESHQLCAPYRSPRPRRTGTSSQTPSDHTVLVTDNSRLASRDRQLRVGGVTTSTLARTHGAPIVAFVPCREVSIVPQKKPLEARQPHFETTGLSPRGGPSSTRHVLYSPQSCLNRSEGQQFSPCRNRPSHSLPP